MFAGSNAKSPLLYCQLLNGMGFFTGGVPHDVAEWFRVLVPHVFQYFSYECRTVRKAGKPARTARPIVAFGQRVRPGNAGQRTAPIDGFLETGLGLSIEHHIEWPMDHDFFGMGNKSVNLGNGGVGVSTKPGGGTQGPGAAAPAALAPAKQASNIKFILHARFI
jgi:hypothetical protein